MRHSFSVILLSHYGFVITQKTDKSPTVYKLVRIGMNKDNNECRIAEIKLSQIKK